MQTKGEDVQFNPDVAYQAAEKGRRKFSDKGSRPKEV
jgi:hypothetical protein